MAAVTHVLGIDIGATKIAAAIIDPTDGTVVREETIATPLASSPGEQLDRCVALAERVTSSTPLAAVGLGICELVGPTGEIRSAEALDWRALDVESAFAHLGPVTIESDVRAAALAEALYGAGRDLASFLYVNAGSGVSSCLVLDGVPHRGAHGAAILIGGPPFDAEEASGGMGIARRHGTGSAQEVVTAAAAGDPQAVELLETGGGVLGAAIGFAVNLLDPEAVVVGGGLALNSVIFRTALERSLHSTVWSDDARVITVSAGELAGRAGVVGAAAAASQRTFSGVR